MIFTRRSSRSAFGFDMTPMIDVVLQLIIFFLFTSQLAQTARSPVDLPQEQGEDQRAANPDTLVIDVGPDGSFLIDGSARPLEDVVRLVSLENEAAKASGRSLDLLIRADRTAAAVHINTLANRLASAGVRRWSLGTTVPAGGAR